MKEINKPFPLPSTHTLEDFYNARQTNLMYNDHIIAIKFGIFYTKNNSLA